MLARDQAHRHATTRELVLSQAQPHVRARVEALLAHLDQGHDQLESPAWDIASHPLRDTIASKPRTLPPGTRIGQFTLREPLGEGGMGAVYRADQATPQRTVAVKILSTPIPSARNLRRFAHEGQSLARFKHPSIVGIIETGQAHINADDPEDPNPPPRPYLAMELVRGRPLLDVTREWPLDRPHIRQRIATLAQIADAVEHAHQRGVWHRDLKSSNVLLDTTSSPPHPPQPHVLDFGVAALTEREDEDSLPLAALGPPDAEPTNASPITNGPTSVTEHRHLVGTYATMAPELLLRGQVSQHADIYALGLLAWEALTGAWPFTTNPAREGDTPTPEIPHSLESALRLAHKRDQNQTPLPTPTPTTLRALRQALGRTAASDLLLILRKSLAFEPSERYASAAALASDLQRVINHEPISLRPRTPGYLLNRFAHRRPAFAATIAAAILTTHATSSIATWQAIRANRASTLASERLKRTTDMIGTITYDLHKSLDTVPESKAARAEMLRLATETARWMALEATDAESLTQVAQSFVQIAIKEGGLGGSSIGNLEKGRDLMDEGIAMLRRAVEIDPRAAHPRWILAKAITDRAQFETSLEGEQHWRGEGVAAFRQAVAISQTPAATDADRAQANQFAYAVACLGLRSSDPAEAQHLIDEADAINKWCLAGEPDNIEFIIERVLHGRIRAESLVTTDPTRAIDLARTARAEFQALLPRSDHTDTPVLHIARCGWFAGQALELLRRFDEADQEFHAANEWGIAACREKPSSTIRLSFTWNHVADTHERWAARAASDGRSPEERTNDLTRSRRALDQAHEIHAMWSKASERGTVLKGVERWLADQDQALVELEARLAK